MSARNVNSQLTWIEICILSAPHVPSIGHLLPQESWIVENTTPGDCGPEGAFLMSDHSMPTFWMGSFKLHNPMEICDGIFYPTYPFHDPSVFQHPGDLLHEDIRAMHEADGGVYNDIVSVLQYELRSHAAMPLHFCAGSKCTYLTC